MMRFWVGKLAVFAGSEIVTFASWLKEVRRR